MADQVRFTKSQRAKAKELGVPLVAIHYEDKHLTSNGNRKGAGSYVGPANEDTTEVYDFLLEFIAKRRKAIAKRSQSATVQAD